MSTINTPNSQIYVNIPRENSVISLSKSNLELKFDVLHAGTGKKYVNGDDKRLVNLGLIALFSIYRLTITSGKNLEKISHAQIVSSLYKLLPSSKDSDDLSIGFHCNPDKRRLEITNNKKINGKYHVRIYLRDILGFAEHQKTATYGLAYKLTMTRDCDNAVLRKGNATNDAKVINNALERYVLQYNPSLEEYKK